MLEPHIVQNITKRKPRKIWVGFSGGLDSTVLLHYFVSKFGAKAISAVYVDHGLSENSEKWASSCADFCDVLAVSFTSRQVKVVNSGKGIEESARNARYDVFESLLEAGDVLVCAHHCDDQLETLLYRLARGAGLEGLCAIPFERPVGKGVMLRPFLHIERQVLLEYATTHSLCWIEDESNSDTRFDRNYLRQSVIPLLKQRWTHYAASSARAAGHLSSARELLDEYADEDLFACQRRKERLGESIDLSVFTALSPLRRTAILRRWVSIQGWLAPSLSHIEQVFNLINAKEDANPIVAWGPEKQRCEFRRFAGRLYLIPSLASKLANGKSVNLLEAKVFKWDMQLPLALGGGAYLSVQNSHNHLSSLDGYVRLKPAGLRCKPRGRQHSQTLKKLLQEYALEPWLRPIVPCVYFGEDLVAVADLWVCDSSHAQDVPEIKWSFNLD